MELTNVSSTQILPSMQTVQQSFAMSQPYQLAVM
jgi:hypothetical protein